MVDRHIGPGLGQGDRDGCANALRGASDQGAASGEIKGICCKSAGLIRGVHLMLQCLNTPPDEGTHDFCDLFTLKPSSAIKTRGV
jgi:hypothetical protein